MMNINETISNLRTAIAYSKRAGNEGQMLANSKGVYRPVSEVLNPALEQLEAIETLIKELDAIRSANFGSESPILKSLNYALSEFQTKSEPNLVNANRAKAASFKK